jgi:hypothetical protein
MSMRIYRAEAGDLPAVLRLLTERAAWMREFGSRQWSGDLLAPERIAGIIAEGGTYLVMRADAEPLATITISERGDPDFWTNEERWCPSLYVSKMATSLEHGRGLGGPVLRWAVDQAAQHHAAWVRLDVFRGLEGATLRAWYIAQGFTWLRDVAIRGKNSGALFQRQAVPDPDAAMVFIPQRDDPQRLKRKALPAGSRVFADYYGPGVVTSVIEPDAGTEHAVLDDPARLYQVRLDTGRVLWCNDSALEPEQALAAR